MDETDAGLADLPNMPSQEEIKERGAVLDRLYEELDVENTPWEQLSWDYRIEQTIVERWSQVRVLENTESGMGQMYEETSPEFRQAMIDEYRKEIKEYMGLNPETATEAERLEIGKRYDQARWEIYVKYNPAPKTKATLSGGFCIIRHPSTGSGQVVLFSQGKLRFIIFCLAFL